MREPASITGKKNLLYESFADHRLPFMEFDCGDKKWLIFMMQRDKNWPRKEKKNPLPVFYDMVFLFCCLYSIWVMVSCPI